MRELRLVWGGCDVSKDWFDLAVALAHQRKDLKGYPCQRFRRSKGGLLECINWLNTLIEAAFPDIFGGKIGVVMEATGSYSQELADWMLTLDDRLHPSIVNARQASAFHKSLSLKNRNDQVDARSLALFGLERRPPRYRQPDPIQSRIRELTREREAVVETLTVFKVRAQQPCRDEVVQATRQAGIQFLKRQLKLLEKQLKDLIARDRVRQRSFAILQSMPGVGVVTASVILAELGDMSQFRRSRQLAAMTGLCPSNKTSGRSVNRGGRIAKSGNRHVRRALYMAAVAAIRGNSALADFYNRLVARGKPKKSAVIALMRKMLVIMRAMLISRSPYKRDFDPSAGWQRPVEKRSKTDPRLRFVPI